MTAVELVQLVLYALDQIRTLVKDPAMSEADDVVHAIAGIFLGRVTKWNDPEITAANPELTLPTADYDSARMQDAARRMPLRLLPDPGEIAEAVVYLARARAVTGQTLFVDGGAHLCQYSRDFLFLEGGEQT